MTRTVNAAEAQSAAPRANRGAFRTEAEALDAVVARLVAEIDPEAIYLFGSRARGRAPADSDFDLLVVTRSEDGDGAYDYDRAYAHWPSHAARAGTGDHAAEGPPVRREQDGRHENRL